MLEGTTVALGVTGSVAAVTVVELVHELQRRGATVRAAMTESARGIIHPDAVSYAADAEVVTELTGAVEHVAWCGKEGWADVCLVAPATANTVGKIAAGIDDTPVTTMVTTALGADVPVVVAPAMHEGMFDHPGVAENLENLEGWGVTVVEPRIEEGKAKIATADAIALDVARAVGPSPLAGRRVVVTSGPTAEPIDPVRVLTNRSSGRTGRAVAKGIYAGGGDVVLLHQDGDVPYAEVRTVETAEAMTEAAVEAAADADALVAAAAVSDFTVDTAAEKLSSAESFALELEPAGKVLDAVREAYPSLPLVGFKLESDPEALPDSARALQRRLDMPFVVANTTDALGGDETAVEFVSGDAVEPFSGSKTALGLEVARRLGTAFA
ncbi:MAG: bifunctional phosphopantothenoylcysteine decarboxylase/phosphopantothenate--cysteine ligase CoaBC [Halodesulfurarchaeum sp.]